MFSRHKKSKIERAFISELDQFLMEYDRTHPQNTISQLEEIKKHEKIFKLRDGMADKSHTK